MNKHYCFKTAFVGLAGLCCFSNEVGEAVAQFIEASAKKQRVLGSGQTKVGMGGISKKGI